MATGHTPFKLNFGKYLWKEDLIIKIELPKLEYFLKKLQESWKIVKKLMEIVKKSHKEAVQQKKQNPQELKEKNNMWLKAKNIYLIDSQRSWIRKNIDSLKSQRTLNRNVR